MTAILQWNINGFYRNLEELKLLIHKLSPPVICLQETRLLPKHKTAVLKNYTMYRSDYTAGFIASGGVAILIQNDT